MHMPRPCALRDYLREAYYQATISAADASHAIRSTPLGPEYVAALDSAEAAHLVYLDARKAYEQHCHEHGCEA